MLARAETRSESFEPRGWRARVAGLVAVLAAGLSVPALAPGRADAGSIYVHSASSGKFAGGRLTLHDVGRSVTWTTSSGRVGVARVARVHERLFSPGKPATGTLHIAGQRGGEERTLRLSKPRYNAARRTVSYRAKPLTKRTGAATAAAAAPRRFGAASLTVVPHASVGSSDNGGNDCEVTVFNEPGHALNMHLVSSSKWDTDDWSKAPPNDLLVGGYADMVSEGGLWRGCHNETVWQSVPERGTVTVDISWPWGQDQPTSTCTPSNPQGYQCQDISQQAGRLEWALVSQ